MKMHFLMALVVTVASATSFAQTRAKRPATKAPASTASATQTTTTPAIVVAPQVKTKFSIGPAYQTSAVLQNAELKQAGGKRIGGGDMATTPALGVTGQYRSHLDGRWSWNAALTAMSERNVENFKGAGQNIRFGDKPSYQTWLVSGGFDYAINDSVYVPFGANMPMFSFTKKGDLESFGLKPALGIQAGVGFVVEKRVQFELLYQAIRYGLEAKLEDGRKFDGELASNGLTLQGRYMF